MQVFAYFLSTLCMLGIPQDIGHFRPCFEQVAPTARMPTCPL